MNKVQKLIPLLLLSMAAWFITSTFASFIHAGYISNRALIPMRNAVSCAPTGTSGTSLSLNQEDNNDHVPKKDVQIPGKENGNGCSHQQGPGALCETSSKRRLFKILNC